jgi:hypothetical protein
MLIRSQRQAFWVVGFVAALFIVACSLPAVAIWQDLPPRTGLWCLILGFVSCFAWLPNPLLLYGSIALLRGRNRTALVAGLIACVCSEPVFLYMAVGGGFQRMHSGYFLWQADIFVFSVAAFGMTKKFGEKPGLVQNEESKSGAITFNSNSLLRPAAVFSSNAAQSIGCFATASSSPIFAGQQKLRRDRIES